MLQELFPALRAVTLLTVMVGMLYPALITGVCQLFFKDKANGSLVRLNGQVIGSALLEQNFSEARYLHPRPSAAGTNGFDPTASSGSNLGPTSQKLFDRVKTSAQQFRQENPTYKGSIPSDALTASGSGLDPQISVANASAQATRIAQARRISIEAVEQIIRSQTQGRDLGVFGEPRVNVLAVNLALDQQSPKQ